MILAVVCVAAAAVAKGTEVEKDEGVYVLTKDNYTNFLNENKFVLIEFYVSFCCHKFAQKYARAACLLAEANRSDIKLAKVDATHNMNLAHKFRVGGYPTLKFLKAGSPEPIDYNGGMTANTIVKWLERKTRPLAQALDDVDAAAVAKGTEVEKDEGVYVLTKDNYTNFLNENKFVLIEFYVSFCCHKFAQKYARAARLLAEANRSDIKLAKVDATHNMNLAHKFRVGGYPTLKFLKAGSPEPIDYNGSMTANTIVKWLERKTRPLAKALDDVDAAAVAKGTEVEKDEGVYVLTKDNYTNFLNENKFVLIEFYVSFCCHKFAQKYARAARLLAEANRSDIKLAKVDATHNMNLAHKFRVGGYPTLKFLKAGSPEPIDYNGGMTANTIVKWLERKTRPRAKALDDVDAAKEFLEGKKVAVIGCFKDQESDGAKAFLKVADDLVDYRFGITSESSILKEYNVTGDEGVILLKDSGNGKAVYNGEYKEGDIKQFVERNALPPVNEYSPEIFLGFVKSYLIVFIWMESDKFESTREMLGRVARNYWDELLVVTVDVAERSNWKILKFFDIKEDEVPTMRIARLGDGQKDIIKFQPKDPSVEEENVKKFITEYLDVWSRVTFGLDWTGIFGARER